MGAKGNSTLHYYMDDVAIMYFMVLRSQEVKRMMQAITNNRKDSRFFDPSCIRISLLTKALIA